MTDIDLLALPTACCCQEHSVGAVRCGMCPVHDKGEDKVRNLWRARFELAWPSATPAEIERAIDNVLADPTGSYANEISITADRIALWGMR